MVRRCKLGIDYTPDCYAWDISDSLEDVLNQGEMNEETQTVEEKPAKEKPKRRKIKLVTNKKSEESVTPSNKPKPINFGDMI